MDCSHTSHRSRQTRGPYRTLDLAAKVDTLRGIANQVIAPRYGINRNALSNFVTIEHSVRDACKHYTFNPSRKEIRTGAYLELEKEPLVWMRQARNRIFPISRKAVSAKALSLSASMGLDDDGLFLITSVVSTNKSAVFGLFLMGSCA